MKAIVFGVRGVATPSHLPTASSVSNRLPLSCIEVAALIGVRGKDMFRLPSRISKGPEDELRC